VAIAYGNTRISGGGTGTNLTGDFPVGLSAGDLMVALWYSDPGTVTGPAGWELVQPAETNADPNGLTLAAWVKLADAADVSAGSAVWVPGGSVFRRLSISRYTGFLGTASSRLDGTPTVAQGDAALVTAQNAPDMTTAVAGSLVVFGYANFSGANVTAMTGFCTNLRNSSDGLTIADAIKSPAGATGTSRPNAGPGSENFIAMHFALLESAGTTRRFILRRP
jgi:hypothetical protein